MKRLVVLILSLSPCHRALAQGTLAVPAASNRTTAWHDGGFHVDVAGVIGRSDIVLGQANVDAAEALPLGKAGWVLRCGDCESRPVRMPKVHGFEPGLVDFGFAYSLVLTLASGFQTNRELQQRNEVGHRRPNGQRRLHLKCLRCDRPHPRIERLWVNFIDGLNSGKSLDTLEFSILYDKGNESNVLIAPTTS